MGFNNKFTKDDFLRAVRRGQSLADKLIADRLGTNRSTIWRYKNNNPDILKEAEDLLRDTTQYAYNAKTKPSIDVFMTIPSIAEWVEIQEKREVKARNIRSRASGLNNVSHKLKTTPDALSIDQCADLVFESRTLMNQGKDAEHGLAYYYIREAIRSWFMLTAGVSGEYLTSKGIDASASKGTGSMARERITKEQRAIFGEGCLQAVKTVCRDKKLDWSYEKIKNASLELNASAEFMYYTGTRKSATFNIMLNDPKHKFTGNLWEIHVLDKGKKGGIHWQKRLTEDGLRRFKKYLVERHGLKEDEIAIRAPDMEVPLFPIWSENDRTRRLQTNAMKNALRLCGAKVKMPNHSWRHTFAQDWLHASDWNYELGAEIGGWKDTGTMKKCYGKMSEDAIDRGLKRAMGIVVEEVTYELRW